jgi:hypothetical protein
VEEEVQREREREMSKSQKSKTTGSQKTNISKAEIKREEPTCSETQRARKSVWTRHPTLYNHNTNNLGFFFFNYNLSLSLSTK